MWPAKGYVGVGRVRRRVDVLAHPPLEPKSPLELLFLASWFAEGSVDVGRVRQRDDGLLSTASNATCLLFVSSTNDAGQPGQRLRGVHKQMLARRPPCPLAAAAGGCRTGPKILHSRAPKAHGLPRPS